MAHVAHTSVFVWTNLLVSQHKHLLVHLSCHSITKIKQGPFSAGVLEPAYTWDHYMASPDATDREGRNFNTKARRVFGELWVNHPRTKMVEISHSFSIFGIIIAIILWVYMQDFYRCEEGHEARANEQAH